MEAEGGLGLTEQFLPFPTLEIRVEDETAGVDPLEENRSDIRQPIRIDRRERHGVGVVQLGALRFAKPDLERREWIGGQLGFTKR